MSFAISLQSDAASYPEPVATSVKKFVRFCRILSYI